MTKNILIIGACGQIGSELTLALRRKYGNEQVIASDIREGNAALMTSGPFEILDAKDALAMGSILAKYQITEVYLMAAMLSATAEKHPMEAWTLNMDALFNVLNLAKDKKLERVFWPSSIAAFGLNTPMDLTPQTTVMDPNTVYGISKLAGERWCAYYHQRYGVDVRSVRFPGLISYKTPPGGGTTDYAIEIFHQALDKGSYTCFLKKGTALPMLYMEDAIRAIMMLMEAPRTALTVDSSYNLAGISFTPEQLAQEIKKKLPDFKVQYAPDFRQAIAESWPNSLADTSAQEDWGWKADFGLEQIVELMLEGVKRLKS